MKFKIIILNLLLLSFVKGSAQDLLLSQQFNANQFSNPALVGSSGYARIQSFARFQSNTTSSTFRTLYLGYDTKINLNDNVNNLGLGINIISDQVMNGIVQSNYINANAAYHIYLNEGQNDIFSLGLGGTINLTSVDAQKFIFEDQFNSGRVFTPSSLDIINKKPTKYAANAGILYTHQTENSKVDFGLGAFYNTKISDFDILNNYLKSFFTLSSNLNYEYEFDNYKTIMLHASYRTFNQTEVLYYGAALGLPFGSEYESIKRFYIGCFARSKEAIVPYIGLLNETNQFGLTYDVYDSKFSASSFRPQTIELSFSKRFNNSSSNFFRALWD